MWQENLLNSNSISNCESYFTQHSKHSQYNRVVKYLDSDLLVREHLHKKDACHCIGFLFQYNNK